MNKNTSLASSSPSKSFAKVYKSNNERTQRQNMAVVSHLINSQSRLCCPFYCHVTLLHFKAIPRMLMNEISITEIENIQRKKIFKKHFSVDRQEL